MIRQILIALGIGCMATVWFMQKDERVKQYIGTKFKTTFQKAVGCTFEGSVESVNFIFPSLTFSNVRVYSADDPGWNWNARRFTAGCSWWHVIMYRLADLRVVIEDLEAQSVIAQGKPAFINHLKKIFMGLKFGLPITLKSVALKNASCCMTDDENKIKARFVWQNEVKKIQGRLKVSGYLLDGSMTMGDRALFESLKGAVHADIGKTDDTTLTTDCSVELPYLPKGMRQMFVAGSWQGTRGTFSLKNVHEQVVIDPIQLFYDGTRGRCSVRGSVPLVSIWRFIHNDAHRSELTGSCSLVCDMRYEDNECAVAGRIAVDNSAYNNSPLGSMVLTYGREQEEWKGAILGHHPNVYGIQGEWQWHEATQSGSLQLNNNEAVQLPQAIRMFIKPDALRCAVQIDSAGHITGDYTATLNSLWNDTVVPCAGSLMGDRTRLASIGTIQCNPYQCEVQLAPTIRLSSFHYDDLSGTPLLKIDANVLDESTMHAVVGLPFIRKLSEQTYKWPLHVEGSIAATLKKNGHNIDISMTTMEALMRIPQTYNVVRDGNCAVHINTDQRVITIRDCKCQFHEGIVGINHAVIHYDADNQPTFMHVPLVVDSLMLNMEQGLFAKISGYALLSKKENKPTDISANIIIDRAYLKENLLSGTFHNNIFNYTGSPFASYNNDTTCDIRIMSRMPVRVKTPFLETEVRVNLQAKNTLKDLQVTGSIDLLSGFLAFPYRPLYISKGRIYFLPNQLHDPSIELLAKNKIKKYNVDLQVSGSLKNHQISLGSTPTLTEEQIIALLVVGSEEESLNVVMPALIMQNLQKIMFGYDQSTRTINKIFANFLQPLNHIHVKPSFSDKTGRGGLRGAIEIDVNERWRALIQNNFSLTEDTRVEVEYQVSDEISVRGVANERRDIGAEVEMRLKF